MLPGHGITACWSGSFVALAGSYPAVSRAAVGVDLQLRFGAGNIVVAG
jgi:hypothetical protein